MAIDDTPSKRYGPKVEGAGIHHNPTPGPAGSKPDIKEVHGVGQAQTRNHWTNVGVYHLKLWLHTLIELWAWHRSARESVDRFQGVWCGETCS